MRLLGATLPLLMSIALLCPTKGMAQRARTVTGEYVYYPSDDISMAKATQIAIDRARVQALQDEFGTVVSQRTAISVTDDGASTTRRLSNNSGTVVKGEWLRDIGEPEIERGAENGILYVRARVKGEARELRTSPIDLDIDILRNGLDPDRDASLSFRDGDHLRIRLESPVSGYVAVYLIDALDNAFCLLPYAAATDGKCQVAANAERVFFDRKACLPDEREEVDEYTLTCEGSFEQNYLYVVFSPKPFTKAADSRGKDGLPRTLPFEDFSKWLTSNRSIDNTMNVRVFNLTIER